MTASAATMGSKVASARTPYPEAARELLRQTLFGAARDRRIAELEREIARLKAAKPDSKREPAAMR